MSGHPSPPLPASPAMVLSEPTRRRLIRCANVLLTGMAAAFALLLAYKWARHGRALPAGMVVALAALTLGFMLALRLRPGPKLRACLLVGSLGAGLLALDLGLLLMRRGGGLAGSSGLGLTSDSAAKLARLEELRRSGPAFPGVVPAYLAAAGGLGPAGDRLLPVAGVSQVTTMLSRESGTWTCYLSDEHGFHNPPGSHSPEHLPLVLIGDSLVHGAAVPAEEDLASHLRQLGQPALNLGFWGNGPLLDLATLTEYGLRLRPRHVFWFYFEGNDLDNLTLERKSTLLTAYLDDGFSQSLATRQAQIDQLLADFCTAQEQRLRPPDHGHPLRRLAQSPAADVACLRHLRTTVANWCNQREFGGSRDHGRVRDADWDLFRSILATAAGRTEASGATFHFVYLPDQVRFLRNQQHNPEWREHRRVIETVHDLKLLHLDLSEQFVSHPDPLSLFNSRTTNSHYNSTGNRLVAESVLQHIRAERF